MGLYGDIMLCLTCGQKEAKLSITCRPKHPIFCSQTCIDKWNAIVKLVQREIETKKRKKKEMSVLKLLCGTQGDASKDYSSIHPRHMEDHLRSLFSRNPNEARRLTILYLQQIFSKFLCEDKVDGSNFDNLVLNALDEVVKKI